MRKHSADPEEGICADILLATYNGGKYLDEQLESLFSQSGADIRVFVRDDGSRDGTVKILDGWQSRHPGAFFICRDLPHTGDPGTNFFSLLPYSDRRYVLFCDQDDVWMPDKIAVSVERMREAELAVPGLPFLLHTDLAVTNSELKVTDESFVRLQNLEPSNCTLAGLIAQNSVTGCTVLMNRALCDLLRPPPAGVLHDWWAALSAAAFGQILYLDRTTVYYRQHGANAVGAESVRSFRHISGRLRDFGGMREALQRTYAAAGAFREIYMDRLSPEQSVFLLEYSCLGQKSALERLRFLRTTGAFKNGRMRRAAQVLLG